jgi:hypothetical protein
MVGVGRIWKNRKGETFYLKPSLQEIAWESDTQMGNNVKITVTKKLRASHKRIGSFRRKLN